MALKVGDTAPDFELPALIGGVKKKWRLRDYLGKKNVVLAFHPLNWTPVCTTQFAEYNAALSKLSEHDAHIVGISVDSIYSDGAWEKEIGPLDYPLVSDYYPHGEVAMKYGVFRDREPFSGVSERAIFVIDKKGKVAFSKVYSMDHLPETKEVLMALQQLNQ